MQLEDQESRFGGIKRLYGREGFEKIKKSRVLIVGLGGVGSWAAEALARSSVGSLTLVDLDDICVTNINRQIHATTETVGKFKTEVMVQRIKQIHPSSEVITEECYFSPKNLERIFSRHYDFVIDACDDFTNKCYLIDHCRKSMIPLVVAGGAGGKTDPLQIEVSDMAVSSNDRLLARLRKKLRQDFSFPLENEGHFGVWAVWSRERAVYPTADECLTHLPPGRAKHMDCEEGFGSASFVTGAFGFAAASVVLREIVKKKDDREKNF